MDSDDRFVYLIENIVSIGQLERRSKDLISNQLRKSFALTTFLDDVK